MLANCSMGGMGFGFPDVCQTPSPVGPIPIPYPSMANLPMALPPSTSMRHLISMMPAHNLATSIPMTMGDNAGAMGGVMSGVMMGAARSLVGSTKVITGGSPATRWLDPTVQNLTNCQGGMTMVPSQFKVLYLS